MNEIKEILENLARVSHQSRGTDSYYTIVEKTLSAIKKKIKSKIGKVYGSPEEAITDIASMFGDKT